MANRNLKVLCVDENQQTFLSLRNLLDEIKIWHTDLNYAPDYRTAWEQLSAAAYDICFFSYTLDRQDGLKFLQHFTDKEVTTAPVLLVDTADHELNGEFLEIGAVDFVVKDKLDVPILKRVIRYAVQHKDYLETQQNQAAARSNSSGHVVVTNESNAAGAANLSPEVQNQLFFNLDVYGIEILDAQGNIIDCNETYQRLLGYSRREIMGQHTTSFASENSKKLFARKFMMLQKQGYTEGELELIQKRWLENHCVAAISCGPAAG